MIERLLLQIPPDEHFGADALEARGEVHRDLEAQQRGVQDHEGHGGVERPPGDVVVDGVFLELREGEIDDGAPESHHHHEDHVADVWLQIGYDLRDAEEAEVGYLAGFIVFVHCSPPPSVSVSTPVWMS